MPIGLNSASMYSPQKLTRSIPQQQTLSFQAGNQQSETENSQDVEQGSSLLRKAVKTVVFMALLGAGVYGVSKCGTGDLLKIGQNASDITKSVYGAINNVGRNIVKGAKFLIEKISPQAKDVVSSRMSNFAKSDFAKEELEDVAEEAFEKVVVGSVSALAAKKAATDTASHSESFIQGAEEVSGILPKVIEMASNLRSRVTNFANKLRR